MVVSNVRARFARHSALSLRRSNLELHPDPKLIRTVPV
jgi:hypothetical protein